LGQTKGGLEHADACPWIIRKGVSHSVPAIPPAYFEFGKRYNLDDDRTAALVGKKESIGGGRRARGFTKRFLRSGKISTHAMVKTGTGGGGTEKEV